MEVSCFLSRLMFASAALISCGAHAQYDDLAFEEFDSDLPVVLTAVRLKQLQSDVPASVTVLHGQTLVDMGIKELSEALRLVPGMMVGYDTNNEVAVVQYHGGPASLPRNLQVLLDGRSMYYASIAAVDWQSIPVAIEDIERIEVVRGPNASSYGSNSFQAIVNILTKHPADVEGSIVNRKQGNNGVQETFARYRNQIGNTDYRFSTLIKEDGGMRKNDIDHKYQSAFIDSQIKHNMFDGSDLTISAIYQETDKPLVSIVESPIYNFSEQEAEVKRQEVGVLWEKSFSSSHKIKLNSFVSRAEHTSQSLASGDEFLNIFLDPDLGALYRLNANATQQVIGNPALLQDASFLSTLTPKEQELWMSLVPKYDFANLDTFSGVIDNSFTETRVDVELQDTLIVGNHLTLVSGAGFRRDVTKSEAFFDGYASNNITRLFTSADWDSQGSWKAHLGLMWEKETDLEAVFNPRAALIYRLGYNQTLRAVVSKSVRSPDMYETQAHWQYKLSDIQSNGPVYGDTFYQVAIADEKLSHEKIISRELGYYYLSSGGQVELDVRLFHEELTDMLDQSLIISDWHNENRISMFFRGVEYQLGYKPFSTTHLRLTAAHIDAGSSENEDTLLRVYARNSGSLAWIQKWPNRITSTLSYYLADSYNSKEEKNDVSTFERYDARIAKTFTLDRQYDLETSFYIQKDLEGEGLVFDEVQYKDKLRYVASVGLKF